MLNKIAVFVMAFTVVLPKAVWSQGDSGCRIPRSCVISQWSRWALCSTRCGSTGMTYRRRHKIVPEGCGGSCYHALIETRSCNRDVCDARGTPLIGHCICYPGYAGTCCEEDVFVKITFAKEETTIHDGPASAEVEVHRSGNLEQTTDVVVAIDEEIPDPDHKKLVLKTSRTTTLTFDFGEANKNLSVSIGNKDQPPRTIVLRFMKTMNYRIGPITKHTIKVIQGKINSTTTTPNTDTNQDKQLSAAAKAGLAVGLFIVICCVFMIVILIPYKRMKRNPKEMRTRPRGIKDGQPKPAVEMQDEWEIDPRHVTFLDQLGKGAFGKVYKAVLKLPQGEQEEKILARRKSINVKPGVNKTHELVVAAKTIHGTADSSEKEEFLKEVNMMKKLGCHQNIVNFLCCCTKREPFFLVVEFVPKGDLLKYLRTNRHKVSGFEGKPIAPVYLNVKADQNTAPDTKKSLYAENPVKLKPEEQLMREEEEEELLPKDLLSFCFQIAAGMEYLSSKGFVHRDLAARNVLVADNKQVKVSDFGLTRDLYEESAYHARVQRRLPIKWMSPEALYDRVFTTESDVWSYGITLWEITTLGGAPYPSMTNKDLFKELRIGYRMEKPDMCSDEIYQIMLKCWQESPSERPDFTQLRQRFEELLQEDSPYMDFSNLEVDEDYYLVPAFHSALSHHDTLASSQSDV